MALLARKQRVFLFYIDRSQAEMLLLGPYGLNSSHAYLWTMSFRAGRCLLKAAPPIRCCKTVSCRQWVKHFHTHRTVVNTLAWRDAALGPAGLNSSHAYLWTMSFLACRCLFKAARFHPHAAVKPPVTMSENW